MIDVIYLHGFASSAGSSKATWFKARFAEHGIVQRTPDFNLPDFSSLTITRMIDQVEAELPATGERPVVLIGSSLGAFVAVQVALRPAGKVDRLVLLAPALDFSGNRLRDLGDRGIDEWRRTGELNVFHYGFGRMVPVRYALFEDAQRYDAMSVLLPAADADLPGPAGYGGRCGDGGALGEGEAGRRPAPARRRSPVAGQPRLHLARDRPLPRPRRQRLYASAFSPSGRGAPSLKTLSAARLIALRVSTTRSASATIAS